MTAKKAMTIALILLLTLTMTACRESLVLTEIIHDQTADTIDHDSKTKLVENNKKNTDEDEKLSQKQDTDTANKKNHQENDSGQNDSDNNNTSGHSSNSEDGEDLGEGEAGETSEGNGSGGASDNPNDREIFDGNGNIIEVPEEVNSVVAPGNAGVLVQMLGGKGVLTGTSEDFLNNSFAKTVFAGEGISEVKKYWEGDGSAPMNNNNFQSLLKAKPDVCIVVDGGSYSDEQIETLKKQNISCFYISLDDPESINAAVESIGELIGDKTEIGGKNAPKIAKEYIHYWHSIIQKLGGENASPTKTTLYISEWDNQATFSMRDSNTTIYSTSGVAVTKRELSDSPLSYYFGVGGFANCVNRFSTESNEGKNVAVIPFNLQEFNNSFTSNIAYLYTDTSYRTRNLAKASDLVGDSENAGLGTAKYPSIIVDSSETKRDIEKSDMWKNYGQVTDDSGQTNYGFLKSGHIVYTEIRGDFDIFVNPYGVTDWTTGSAESVLESIWVAEIVGGNTKVSIQDEIEYFYNEFYGYDIAEKNPKMVENILLGR
jgi:ABC-type Fe3+-hydroxamate transport system substrate-binding protein